MSAAIIVAVIIVFVLTNGTMFWFYAVDTVWLVVKYFIQKLSSPLLRKILHISPKDDSAPAVPSEADAGSKKKKSLRPAFLQKCRSSLVSYATETFPHPIEQTEIFYSRVGLEHMDVYGVMNNSRYFSMSELARFDFTLRKGLWTDLLRKRVTPFFAGTMARFRRSLTYGKRVKIETRFIYIDSRYLYTAQVFRDMRGRIHTVMLHRLVFTAQGKIVDPTTLCVAGETTSRDTEELNKAFARNCPSDIEVSPPQCSSDALDVVVEFDAADRYSAALWPDVKIKE